MSKFCPKCGVELKGDEKICKSCGAEISADNSPETTSHARYREDSGIAEILLKRTGRLNRLRYFKRTFSVNFIGTILVALLLALFTTSSGALTGFGRVVVTALLIVGELICYCLNVRRLHDLNHGETLAYVVLAIGIVSDLMSPNIFVESTFNMLETFVDVSIGLYMLFCPGTHGENKYGADPLG